MFSFPQCAKAALHLQTLTEHSADPIDR